MSSSLNTKVTRTEAASRKDTPTLSGAVSKVLSGNKTSSSDGTGKRQTSPKASGMWNFALSGLRRQEEDHRMLRAAMYNVIF